MATATRHPPVADSRNNIGEVLRHKGKYDEALEMRAKSLEIGTRIYGDSHALVADSFNNMANIYYAQGKYEEALEIAVKCTGNHSKSGPASKATATRSWPTPRTT